MLGSARSEKVGAFQIRGRRSAGEYWPDGRRNNRKGRNRDLVPYELDPLIAGVVKGVRAKMSKPTRSLSDARCSGRKTPDFGFHGEGTPPGLYEHQEEGSNR